MLYRGWREPGPNGGREGHFDLLTIIILIVFAGILFFVLSKVI